MKRIVQEYKSNMINKLNTDKQGKYKNIKNKKKKTKQTYHCNTNNPFFFML